MNDKDKFVLNSGEFTIEVNIKDYLFLKFISPTILLVKNEISFNELITIFNIRRVRLSLRQKLNCLCFKVYKLVYNLDIDKSLLFNNIWDIRLLVRYDYKIERNFVTIFMIN